MSNAIEQVAGVFLDKDGTLLRDVPYNADPTLIEWQAGALEALVRLKTAGFALVLVTNQSGVAHGRFSERDLMRYLSEVQRSARAQAGVGFERMLYCPHHPSATLTRYRRVCACRKPNPGMIVRAAASLRLDLKRSWMVGDLLDDIEAGARAGCSTALVNHDGNESIPSSGLRSPDVISTDLASASWRIADSLVAVA